jgi:hypothetical protein
MGRLCNTPRLKKTSSWPFIRSKSLTLMAGGGGRTRTYEGLASGFTVRPLCHSGHSPAPAKIKSRRRKRPGPAEAYRVRLMLPQGSACQLEYAVDRTTQRIGVWAWALQRNRPRELLSARVSGSACPCCDASQPAGRSARATSELPNRSPALLSKARRPYGPSAAGHRPSPRRGRRPGSPPRHRRCDRRFRDRRRPRRFR